MKLSVGEKQRINLARALLKDSSFLVLDEPTSALDQNSESIIWDHLKQLKSTKTIIWATHQISTTLFADKVIVLDKGKIIESGPPNELRGKSGLYSQWLAK